MQDLGAVVRQFTDLTVGEARDHPCVGHDAGVGRHDAVDVGPGPDLVGVQTVAQDRSAVVASAPAQGRRHALRGGADEPGHHGYDTAFKRRSEASRDLRTSRPHQRHCVLVGIVGDDQLSGVHGLARGPSLPEQRSQDARIDPLTQRRDCIHGARGDLSEHVHAVAERRELFEVFVHARQ